MNEIVVIMNSTIFWVVWIACTLISTYMGVKKGIGLMAFLNGIILGPLGVLIVLIQDDSNRISCPSCAEKVMKEAKICPHCQRTVTT